MRISNYELAYQWLEMFNATCCSEGRIKYFYSSLLQLYTAQKLSKRMKKMLKIVSSASSVNDFNPFYQKPFQDSAHRLTENHE